MPRRSRVVFQDNALLDPARQAALLDRVKQLGGSGIQQDIAYGDVHRAGAYDYSKYTALANAAKARGLSMQVRLRASDSVMQRRDPTVDMALNTQHPNAGLLKQFATDTARNFGGLVSKYSIWNEPNIGPARSRGMHNAAKLYRELFQAGEGGVRAGNPNAKVGFGEVVAAEGAGAGSAGGFIKEVLGIGNHPLKADYVALHPYMLGNPAAVTAAQRAEQPDYGGVGYLGGIQHTLADAFRHHQLQTRTGKRSPLEIGEFSYQHSWVPNAHKRAQYIAAGLKAAQQAGVGSVNLYQMLPTQNRASDWDSSVMNAQGKVDPAIAEALKRMRGR